MVGMLMTGVFATKAIYPGGADGLAYGNPAFFLTQLKAMGCAVGYSFVVSYAIFKFINFIVPLRVSDKEEEEGLDASQHNEKYVQGTILVATTEGMVEKEVQAEFFETIATVSSEKTNGTIAPASYLK
jgi:Amt family ammonium transporter